MSFEFSAFYQPTSLTVSAIDKMELTPFEVFKQVPLFDNLCAFLVDAPNTKLIHEPSYWDVRDYVLIYCSFYCTKGSQLYENLQKLHLLVLSLIGNASHRNTFLSE